MADEKEKLIPRLRRKYAWLDHVFRANEAFGERYGNHYAAAITYFSVLSLFPLLMVGFSVAGFVLAGNQTAINELRTGILSSAPQGLGSLFTTLVDSALAARGGTGILGLLLALYSGIGWMTNLRDALTAQWGQEKKNLPLVSTTLKDLASLVGLGLALVVSFGLTAVGGGIGKWLLRLVGLDDQGWALFLLKVATVVLSLLANMLVFLWVLSRLPREKVGVRSALKGAAIAAVGFEILKQVATVYLSSVTSSPSGAIFGPIIGLLVFANLVSRFLLFVTAWTATARENMVTVVDPPPPAVIRPAVTVRRGPGAGSVVGAFGAGAVLAWLGKRRR
ncbi:inner membrane protein YhjD [Amycolatopsis acidiphila]|uniref:Inner membrane protein YhjD n=1 Tax=Amycolatopsis acidiphila TaxID=715473 RepID=A0A557ZXZ9_9PSEU|nr:inner membrane protein YhjD [Amycolatopsis acidiphila]TVT16893.1 inner membrane protein YhjD [Amycolatopsis acidiphila]UIJ60814.1 inner membrane protein YhjD [Amycolatopsis acidiphila]GHG94085.1 inner membrane protein YhjD [Amycolatopsis acidiphila]